MKKTGAPIKGKPVRSKILALSGFLVLLLIAITVRLLDDGQGMKSYVGSLIALSFMLTASSMIVYDSAHNLAKTIKNRRKQQDAKPSVYIEQDATIPDSKLSSGDHSHCSAVENTSERSILTGNDHNRLDITLSIVYSVLLIGVAVFLSYSSITAALDLPHVIEQDYKTEIMLSPVGERHSNRGHIYYTLEDKAYNDSKSFRISRQTFDKLKTDGDHTVIIKYLPLSHKTMDVEVR